MSRVFMEGYRQAIDDIHGMMAQPRIPKFFSMTNVQVDIMRWDNPEPASVYQNSGLVYIASLTTLFEDRTYFKIGRTKKFEYLAQRINGIFERYSFDFNIISCQLFHVIKTNQHKILEEFLHSTLSIDRVGQEIFKLLPLDFEFIQRISDLSIGSNEDIGVTLEGVSGRNIGERFKKFSFAIAEKNKQRELRRESFIENFGWPPQPNLFISE